MSLAAVQLTTETCEAAAYAVMQIPACLLVADGCGPEGHACTDRPCRSLPSQKSGMQWQQTRCRVLTGRVSNQAESRFSSQGQWCSLSLPARAALYRAVLNCLMQPIRVLASIVSRSSDSRRASWNDSPS